MPSYVKSQSGWARFNLVRKETNWLKPVRMSARPASMNWKAVASYNADNTLIIRTNAPTATTISTTSLGEYTNPTQVRDLTNDTVQTYTSSTRYFNVPEGEALLELTLPAGKSIQMSTNSVVVAIEDLSNFKGASYPAASSTVLTYVPDYLPESITSLTNAFNRCTSFNQQLNWDTSNITNMGNMFRGCTVFNQPVNFDTSNVTTTGSMFYDCAAFNQPLNFDTSKVTNMAYMFKGCTVFNQPVNFNTANVTQLGGMFYDCAAFNQPIGTWDVSNVSNFNQMFYNATKFNQYIKNWVIKTGATSSDFRTNSALTAANSPF